MLREGVARHVIFDLDGTLIDSCAMCVAILSEMSASRGGPDTIDPVTARRYMSAGGIEMVAGLLGPACGDPIADLAEFRHRYQSHRTPQDTLFPYVAEGLRQLREVGYILSICSNKPQYLCEKVLEDVGLAGHFAQVVGGQPTLRPKPSPDLLNVVLNGLSARADDCLFVGDSELDHEIARCAAIPFHFMSYGYAADMWVAEDCTTHHSFRSLTDTIIAQRVDA